MGLAPDGGLMLPEQYPQIDRATLDQWRTLSYPELAFEVMSLFATDIPADDLRDIINRTYTEEVFGTKAITPVRTLSDGIKNPSPCPMARLWHSKTWLCNSWAMRLNMY